MIPELTNEYLNLLNAIIIVLCYLDFIIFVIAVLFSKTTKSSERELDYPDSNIFILQCWLEGQKENVQHPKGIVTDYSIGIATEGRLFGLGFVGGVGSTIWWEWTNESFKLIKLDTMTYFLLAKIFSPENLKMAMCPHIPESWLCHGWLARVRWALKT